MAFELYQPNSRMRSQSKEVVISKLGLITISAAAREEHIPKATAVHLLYDAERRMVAIKPVPESADHCLKIRHPNRSRSVQVSATGFLDFNQIPHEKPVRLPVKWDEDLKALVFSLNKPAK